MLFPMDAMAHGGKFGVGSVTVVECDPKSGADVVVGISGIEDLIETIAVGFDGVMVFHDVAVAVFHLAQ